MILGICADQKPEVVVKTMHLLLKLEGSMLDEKSYSAKAVMYRDPR